MRKILLIGCTIILIACAPRKTKIETEGLEEVVVYGEEEVAPTIIEEPVYPEAVEEPAPVISEVPEIPEEVEIPAPVVETPVIPEVPEEVIAPPPVEEVVTPPPIEEVVTPPPIEEVVTPPPIEEPLVPVEEVVTPPALPEIPEAPEEVAVLPPVTEEPIMAPIEEPTVPPPPPAPAPANVFGFRIQIFASSTENNANKVADDARSAFAERIYVQHVPPYYKVRAGDCLTRAEAEKLKKKALTLGYRGAFVVETMISP
jgi:hypothetical protein